MKNKLLLICVFVFPIVFVSLILRDDPEVTSDDKRNVNFEKQKEHLDKVSIDLQNNHNSSLRLLANLPDLVCYNGQIPAYPSGIFGHASAVLGDTLYICGGVEDDIGTNYVFRYHIPYGEWSNGRNMPFIKAGGDLVQCGNALYYIGGGTTVASGNFVTMRYRPTAGWDTVARIPVTLSGNTAESWGDSVIFCIAGGWSQYYGKIQVYRPALNTWTVIADSLPSGMGRRTHASGIVGNKIFVAAGFSAFYRNDMMIGTIGSSANQISWVQSENINCRGGMSRPGGVGIDGHFYVIGAETNPGPALQDSIFIYDVEGSRWLTPLSGRGGGTSSNYWGTISAKIINDNVNVYIPGGSLTGTTQFGLYTARVGTCNPDPIDTVLVLTGDSTVGTAAQINGRRADRDTLFKYLNAFTNNYDVRYKDTSANTIPSIINSYKTIIIHELASDAASVRFMGPAWRNAIKIWINSGSPADKRTLILIGGDMGYNYGRSNSPVYDSVLSKNIGKFSYRSDNGNLPSQNKITWITGNYSDSMTTVPIGVNFWPDGCSLLSGGTALANYTGRSSSDSLAIIGNASNSNYVVVAAFQDPRYFVGSGGTTGNAKGFKRVLGSLLGWVKQQGGSVTEKLRLDVQVIPEGFYNTSSGRLNSKDTIRAYLRNTISPYNIVEISKSIIDSVSFNASFEFPNASAGTYYIIMKHRNSIETWSKAGGEGLSSFIQNNFNFTSFISQAFGNNQTLKGAKYCIYSGDVNLDGIVDGGDLSLIDNDAYNFVSGYVSSDVDGNNNIDGSDAAITDNNATNFIGVITP